MFSKCNCECHDLTLHNCMNESISFCECDFTDWCIWSEKYSDDNEYELI